MLEGVNFFTFIIYLYIMFWVFSVLGWIVEILSYIIMDRKLVNRGFFIGPYCPIYGFGSFIMLGISKISSNLFVCFILSMIICSIFEYVVGVVLEKIFGMRWWDYSHYKFHINGRVCLLNSVAFGALGVLYIHYLLPLYDSVIRSLDINVVYIIALVILIITLVDILVSINILYNMKKIVGKQMKDLKNRDATDDVKKIVNNEVKTNYIYKRLIKAYHLLEKTNKKTRDGFSLIFVFAILGIIVGLIISLYYKIGSYKIIVPIALSIGLLIAYIVAKVGNK